MEPDSYIGTNLKAVYARIARAAVAVGRDPGDIRLIAVSKTFPVGDIATAYRAGQTAFGESYVQEALAKIAALPLPIEWHFIGPLQSNKTRDVAEHFAWVHSVDRLKVAQRLSEQRPPQLGPLQICLQVNISGEVSKGGVTPTELTALARSVARLPRLVIRGLMAVPAPTQDVEQQKAAFARLRTLQRMLIDDGHGLDTLSMGMSDDMEAAIAEGTTMVRVGRAIFGERA